MRTPSELIAELVQCGGRITYKDGKPTLSGSVPDALILEIRDQKQECLAAWELHAAAESSRRGWGSVPQEVPTLRRKAPAWSAAGYRRMESWARRQPDAVVQWMFARVVDYKSKRPDWRDRDAISAAIWDLWEWQVGKGHQDPEPVVAGFEEAMADNGGAR